MIWKMSYKAAVLLLTSMLLASCGNQDQTHESAVEESNRAILNQLNEVQQEIKSLRQDVSSINKAVTEIHRLAIEPPQAKAPAKKTVPKVTIDDDPVLGDTNATIAIVEFSDYQCPYCRRHFKQTFPKLKRKYIDTGKVQYIYKDYPLNFHPQAKGAAIAANCAGEQGKYWQMHDELFSQQRKLGEGLFVSLAQELKMDVSQFSRCLGDSEQSREVDEDQAYGESLGVQGTPHFFIGRMENGDVVNAVRISGALPFASFSKHLDVLLGKQSPSR